MLRIARIALTIGKWANWITGVPIIGILLIGSFVPGALLKAAREFHSDPAEVSLWFRLTALCFLVVVPLIHIVFTRLIRIINSIPLGDVFSMANADNLRIMAWALLIFDGVDLAYGAISMATVGHTSGWSPSFIGWFTALMLFVLAEVWRQGAAMRDDLEGTV